MAMLYRFMKKTALQEDDQGRTVFYPWGAFGPAYETTSEKVKDKLDRFYLCALLPIPFVVMISHYVPIAASFLILAIFTLIYFAAYRRLLQRTPGLKRLTKEKSVPNFLGNFSYVAIIGGLLGSLTFVGLGSAMLIVGNGKDVSVGIAASSFFGLCAMAYAWLLITKFRQRS
jgi:preprotein translocase subunit YajC